LPDATLGAALELRGPVLLPELLIPTVTPPPPPPRFSTAGVAAQSVTPERRVLGRPWLLVPGPALAFQPGVDVRAPLAGEATDPDERRPGSFLPPPLKGTQTHLQFVGELLLD
jgi:hypothetical protein